ncbi:MAG: indole-3-glycerol phosphate synthase TrpC [Eubacteriales bacterium]
MRNENGEEVDGSRNILEEIADCVRTRVERKKKEIPLETLCTKVESLYVEKQEIYHSPTGDFPFEKALKEKGMSFICEVKKASPSKGLIANDFPYVEIAKEYEQAGASAISCLTEPRYFQGQDAYLEEITQAVTIPVLRKDFFIDEYMIYEAKVLGASAILLICAILTEDQLKRFFAIAEELGLSAIFEVHDEEEVQMAMNCGARIIGVNNRNLKTFELDLQTSVRLRSLVDEKVLFISESGIRTREDIQLLEQHNMNAVLIGETLMRSNDKKQMLEELKGIL